MGLQVNEEKSKIPYKISNENKKYSRGEQQKV
jgi:hypothetical protein